MAALSAGVFVVVFYLQILRKIDSDWNSSNAVDSNLLPRGNTSLYMVESSEPGDILWDGHIQ